MMSVVRTPVLNVCDTGGMQSPRPDSARLWLAPLSLAGCVRAVLLRDTRGQDLQGAQLDNYFPATPLVTVLWFLQGGGDWLPSPGFSTPAVDHQSQPLMFGGPFLQPTHTRSHGPVQTLQLLMLPDAFGELTGVDPGDYLNRMVDASRVLPTSWLTWANALAALPDDGSRLASIEAFLVPQWARVAPQRPGGDRYAQWAQALAVRAATSAAGRSVRQIERRVKAWVGLPMRELRAVSRAENAFLAVAAAHPLPSVNWADIAADNAYADQSHLCRETRRLTGFSPEDLRRRILIEEAFWSYRLWR